MNGEAHHQIAATSAMAGTKIAKPLQESSCSPANIMFRLTRAPVINTKVTWTRMKRRNHHIARKWIDRARCRFNILPNQPSRFEIAGPCMKPVRMDVGAATNMVMK